MSVKKRQRLMLTKMFQEAFARDIPPEKHAEALKALIAEFPEHLKKMTRGEFQERTKRCMAPFLRRLQIVRD